MKSSKFTRIASIVLLFTVCSMAQINLSQIYCAAVKDGGSVPTKIDSVTVSTVVGNGIAKTLLTMVIQPQGREPYVMISDTLNSTSRSSVALIDSIEISTWFTLPTDFVATDMWLWVGDQKVKALIQDRTLAQAQYTQIVGTRKDPAILSTYGNGSYDLKIFPASSFTSRKIEIAFEHTFDDDSASFITATIPVRFDSTSYYYYNEPRRPVGSVIISCEAVDNRTYDFSMPGLGTGTFSKYQPLQIAKSSVANISVGTISSADPSGSDEFLWKGIDKNSTQTIGFTTALSESTVTLAPEPSTRIIVLDVRRQMWNQGEYYRNQATYRGYSISTDYYSSVDVWKRAQKFAVMSIQNYVVNAKSSIAAKFNLVINGKVVFDLPVAPTAANIRAAYLAIVAAHPDSAASTTAGIAAATAQGDSGIVILISDQYQPYDAYLADWSGLSQHGKNYIAMCDSVGLLIKSKGATLFTIADDWNITKFTSASGGFNLASLQGYYYFYCLKMQNTDGAAQNIPQLPALYGNRGFYYGNGISNLLVTSGKNQVQNIVFTANQNSYGWCGYMPIMMMKRQAKTAAVYPYSSYNSAVTLRVAATVSGAATSYPFVISGKIGGLKFTKEFTARAGLSGMSSVSTSQWPWLKTEQLASSYEDWQKNADTIKAIGMDYSIVTRQTSFLALEPGMEMWPDTIGSNSSAPGSSATSTVGGADLSMRFLVDAPGELILSDVSNNLDNVSLEDIINGAVKTAVTPAVLSAKVSAQATYRTGVISIKFTSQSVPAGLSAVLYTVAGKQVSRTDFDASSVANANYIWNIRSTKCARGMYMLALRGNGFTKTIPVAIY